MKSAVRNMLRLLDAQFDTIAGERVLRHMIATVLLARTALYASTIMGFFITGLAWSMTRAPIFLGYLLVNLVIGVVRAHKSALYAKLDFDAIDWQTLLAHDRDFLAWSTAFAINIGMTCFSLIDLSNDGRVMPLALTVCVGYSIAFMTRAAGRLTLALFQIVGMTAAPIGLLLVSDKPASFEYAVMCAAAATVSIAMACSTFRKSVALSVADEENRRMARHDMLTGLPNRYAMAERLGGDAQAEIVVDRPFAVLTVDIDRFKEINDTLGHSAGDAVIVATGRRLAALAGRGDFIARLGGDEFILLTLGGACDRAHAQDLADRINAAMTAPFAHDGHSVVLSASIGVALYPDHGTTTEQLLQRADIALYEAKRQRRNQSCIFDSAMQIDLNDRRLLEAEIRTAIAADRFEAWYQPILDMRSREIVGYEALARWRHPAMGMVSPERFIAVAERSDAIFAIGRAILLRACREAANWPDRLIVAVNISTVEFRRPRELVASIRQALAASGLAPHRLYIEITESVLIDDSTDVRRAIHELVQFGVHISLDDFGTGYSSLSYVQDYPFSKIKIDKKFIDHVDTDRKSRAIVTSIAALASGLAMEVIAEGVETPAQEKALLDLGVTLAQGYLYGRPTPEVVRLEKPRIAC